MKLKGKTTIELTDVNTGEVTTVEHENMMTNALNIFFNHNPMGLFNTLVNTRTIKYFNKYFIPICPNLLGGILLFSEALEENADKLLVGSSELPMAYASNNTNPYDDTMRGSMNLNESMAIDKGYKFVWDFTTSQGNGTIAALALTSCYGGAAVYGNAYDDTSPWFLMKQDEISGHASEIRTLCLQAVEMDIENEIMYSMKYSTEGIYIYKVHMPIHSIGITDNLDGSTYEILEEKVIVPSTFQFVDYINLNGAFYDGRDGYWYGFGNRYNSSGSATVYWIKISKADYSFTEGKWTLANTYLEEAGVQELSYGNRTSRGCIRNGYLYILAYNRKGVYKINVNTPADITLIPLGITTNDYGVGNGTSPNCVMVLIEDILVGKEFMILADDTVVLTKGDDKLMSMSTPLFQWKQFLVSFSASYRNIYLLAPYLATINNLPSAVVKTADKTMKITYTLTEAEE